MEVGVQVNVMEEEEDVREDEVNKDEEENVDDVDEPVAAEIWEVANILMPMLWHLWMSSNY